MSSTINTVSGTSTSAASATTSKTGSLGKDDFLKLLVAQLKNQDPLQPQDNTAFIAQLAQFSSLEQLQNVSGQLDSLLTAQTTGNQVAETSLVGKTVHYTGNTVTTDGQSGGKLQAVLADSADKVSTLVTDSSGKIVRLLSSTNASAGKLDIAWDGLDQNGNPAPAGTYTLTVSAAKTNGTAVSLTEQTSGVVTGVTVSGNTTKLLVGSTSINLTDVSEIDQ